MSTPVDTTADFTRTAALPVLQPPAGISPWPLASWIARAQVRCALLTWKHPDEEQQDPGFHAEINVRAVTISGSTDTILVPRDIPSRTYGSDGTAGSTLDVDRSTWAGKWSAVSYKNLAMVEGESTTDFEARTANALRWDSESAAGAPLSIPHSMDESILISFGAPAEAPAFAPLLSALPGALELSAPNPPHLLATAVNGTDGELDTQLLRAPATGVFRFERYQHVVRDATGNLTLRRPSWDGRISIRTTPLSEFPSMKDAFDDVAELDAPLRLVYEHVRANSLPSLLPPLLVELVRRFETLVVSELFAKDKGNLRKRLRETVGWILRTWHAVYVLDPSLATIPASVESTLTSKIPLAQRKEPNDTAITEVVAAIVANSDAWLALVAFVEDVFVHLLIGEPWSEVGLAIDPSGEASGSDAELEAIEFSRIYERWVPCFAGAALAKAGIVWLINDAVAETWTEWTDSGAPGGYFSDVAEAWRNCFTTFDVEALYQAKVGGSGETEPDHAAARAAGLISESEIINYGDGVLGGHRKGWFAILRIVENEAPKRPYSTIDWLGEVLRGNVRRQYQLPLLAFEKYADGGHPLAELVDWETFVRARVLRNYMDELLEHEVGGTSLQLRSIGWWSTATHLDDGGMWPSNWSIGARVQPWPRRPYQAAGKVTQQPITAMTRDRAETRGRTVVRGPLGDAESLPWNVTSGLDDFDLLTALRVAAVVRDGRTLTGPVHPALVLAVAEAEGFRGFGRQNRIRRDQFQWMLTGDPSGLTSKWDDTAARLLWTSWTFGGDIMSHSRRGHGVPILVASEGMYDNLDDYTQWLINRLMRVDSVDQPGTTPPATPIDPATSLLEPDWLPAGNFCRYTVARIKGGKSMTPAGIHTHLHTRWTRRLEYAGWAMQAAIFQWVQHQLSEGTGYLSGETYTQIDEFTDLVNYPPPDPGTDALSPERRTYIAYWSAVYMAFNTSVGIWNHWIETARDHPSRGVDERITEFLLYRLDNSTVDPATLATEFLQKRLGVLGAMTSFAATLDAYLRLDYDLDPSTPAATDIDSSDPNSRSDWGAAP